MEEYNGVLCDLRSLIKWVKFYRTMVRQVSYMKLNGIYSTMYLQDECDGEYEW